jgi:hypothetical protein
MLDPLKLDEVTYSDLVDRSRRRIPGLSGGLWTDHNASDPGLTLVELLAYLLDQRSYWLDQVTPELERAILGLFGMSPLRARAARTVLTARPVPGAGHVVLRQGTALETDGAAPLGFTVEESITALELVDLDVRPSAAGGASRKADRDDGRTFVLFPSDGGAASVEIALRLAAPWTGAPPPVSLHLELAGSGKVHPEWDPDAVDAPPAVKLQVAVSTPGGLAPVPAFRDGTLGLRRSGVVRVTLPASFGPSSDGWHRIVLSTPAAVFSVPPRLVSLGVNAVVAAHRLRARTDVTQDWPKLPGRTLRLSHPNGPPLPGRVRVAVREPGGWRRWREVETLAAAGPADRVFVVDGELLRFGDGRAGRQPVFDPALPAGAVRLVARWWAGGGVVGNLGAGRSFDVPPGRAALALDVVNPVAGVGGRADEPVPDATRRAAEAQDAPTRAVTGLDHETIAEATPGVDVARAIAAVGLAEELPFAVPGLVTVFAIPWAPRDEPPSPRVEAVDVPAPVPDPGALGAVAGALGRARLAGSTIRVVPPRYRPVAIALQIRSGAPAVQLRPGVWQALRRYLDPLVGGDDDEGWPLGGALEPSGLLRVAQGALGAAGVIDALSVGLVGGPLEPCDAVAIGRCELPVLQTMTLQVKPVTGSGGLR